MCKYCERIEQKMMETATNGSLRVWHIPQLPMEAFYYPVKNVEEAKLLLNVLAQYDLFQYEHNVKGDYSNVSGLEEYGYENENGEICWAEYYDNDGRDIGEMMEDNYE